VTYSKGEPGFLSQYSN